MTITQDRLKDLFDYELETGKLVWRNCARDYMNGREAGVINNRGYRYIRIDGVMRLAHRLVWLREFGTEPVNIDHVNRVKTDNRLCNLREATRQQNNANRPMAKKKSGLPHGVQRVSYSKTYRASIKVNHKSIHLGSFATPDEAREAYRKAALHHFGEFALVA